MRWSQRREPFRVKPWSQSFASSVVRRGSAWVVRPLRTMTEHDITRIESSLGIRLPSDYRQFVLSPSAQPVSGIFSDAEQAIATNESRRQMSWLGRPLDRVFYIFGADETGRELFLDLDFPEPPVMVADHEHRRGTVLAQKFGDWISRYDVA